MKMNKIMQQNPPKTDFTVLRPSKVSWEVLENISKDLIGLPHFSIDRVVGTTYFTIYFSAFLSIIYSSFSFIDTLFNSELF